MTGAPLSACAGGALPRTRRSRPGSERERAPRAPDATRRSPRGNGVTSGPETSGQDGRLLGLRGSLVRRRGRRRLGDGTRLEHRHLTVSCALEDDEGRGRQRGFPFSFACLAFCLMLGNTLLALPFTLFLPSLASGLALRLPFGTQALPLLESCEASCLALLLALLAQRGLLRGARTPSPRRGASLPLRGGTRHLGRARHRARNLVLDHILGEA